MRPWLTLALLALACAGDPSSRCYCSELNLCDATAAATFQLRQPAVIESDSPMASYLQAVYGDLTFPARVDDLEFWYAQLLPANCPRGRGVEMPCPRSDCRRWLPLPPPSKAALSARIADAYYRRWGEQVLLTLTPAQRKRDRPKDGAWVEVMRLWAAQEDHFVHYGCWSFVTRGSGIWVNVGRKTASFDHSTDQPSFRNHELAALLGEHELRAQTLAVSGRHQFKLDAFDLAWGALLPSRNFSSAILYNRLSAWKHSNEIALFSPGCLAGKGALARHCASLGTKGACACMPDVELRVGWGASTPCASKRRREACRALPRQPGSLQWCCCAHPS